MPRHADHEKRREELAKAVCHIILEGGIDDVSVRSVAQQSGWSVGAVRYYFPKQEDLLEHALRRTVESWLARIREVEANGPEDPSERGIEMILAIAPVNEVNRNELRIWLAFVDRGLSQERIASQMDFIWETDRYNSRRIIAAIAGLPLPTDLDQPLEDPFLEDTASVLQIMWDGICFQGILAQHRLSPEDIRRLAQRVLNTISQRVISHMSNGAANRGD